LKISEAIPISKRNPFATSLQQEFLWCCFWRARNKTIADTFTACRHQAFRTVIPGKDGYPGRKSWEGLFFVLGFGRAERYHGSITRIIGVSGPSNDDARLFGASDNRRFAAFDECDTIGVCNCPRQEILSSETPNEETSASRDDDLEKTDNIILIVAFCLVVFGSALPVLFVLTLSMIGGRG
jgi:hypothetical protein